MAEPDSSADTTDQTLEDTLMNTETSSKAQDKATALYKFPRFKTVCLLVGDEKAPFHVHKDLFAAKSSYFRGQFKECWVGEKEEIELKEVTSEVFDIIAYWMYSDKLPAEMTEFPQPMTWEFYNNVARMTLHTYKSAEPLMTPRL